MGKFFNPPATSFCDNDIYVDKTGLIAYINGVINTKKRLTCFSRPRRFGKTLAAQMLSAYYSRGADSKALFDKLSISRITSSPFQDPTVKFVPYETYLNKLDVLAIDMAWFMGSCQSQETLLEYLKSQIISDIQAELPETSSCSTSTLPDFLLNVNRVTGRKFFIIIDEWDVIFREAEENTELQKAYLLLLRCLFKGLLSPSFVAGAYLTGILPIKKYGTQSTLTDFREFTMLDPRELAPFVGFTEEEVQQLCNDYHVSFSDMKRWYDGYQFDQLIHIYNPNSVMEALSSRHFDSYWTQSSTYSSLQLYIELNFDGLKEAILDLIGGHTCRIDTAGFQNDMTSASSRDDVLTLLAHLGYLAYHYESKTVGIPNEEIRNEFILALKKGKRSELVKAIDLSNKLLAATLKKDEKTVAECLEQAHFAQTSPQHYNDEQALRSVVILSYLSSVDHYVRFEELAGGRGYVDILFMPAPANAKPALLLELKMEHSAESALHQIEEKQYTEAPARFRYHGKLLLVGISYNSKTGRHSCRIQETVV